MRVEQVRSRLRTLAEREGSIDALARKVGVSRNYLSMTISGKRMPKGKILAFLKLRREIIYLKEVT